ncbi:MAG: UDP-glucose 6-dehydrogenase [Rhodospirillaceae bacterium]|jgi:UDPglucose 6-dehydrogenase|nr:UDP-glucose 6-dehydrogenase [Rhodospirillaceae bacterium]
MKIAMIGAGYVGLVSGACFSEFGVDVVCVDKDDNKIKQLNSCVCPIYEPGLENLITSNVNSKRLFFTTDLSLAMKGADAVFIAVGTPSRRGDGHADLSFVYKAAEEVAANLQGYTVIVTKSTVPVGTGREVKRIIRNQKPDGQFDIASNPEFLREGAAISDFMRPDRVVIGTENKRAADVLSELYRPLNLLETPIVQTTLETAELIKYAANSFLATKVTFINEFATLCEKLDADIQDVARGIGLDGRIGSKFLHAGPGYGGSCFPKDTLALVKTAQEAGAPIKIVETVVDINNHRKVEMADKVSKACGGSVKDKTIAVLGLTFKPNTDDMRDSPSLVIIPELQKSGAKIKAFDPQGMREAKNYLHNVVFCKGPYEAMDGAHAVVIITEWNAFRALDLVRVKSLLKTPILVDLRNIYNLSEMEKAGFIYYSIGRKELKIGS